MEEQSIDFITIQKFNGIYDNELFNQYLDQIYINLVEHLSSHKNKGLSHRVFLAYLDLPFYLSDKLFKIFDEDKDHYLNRKEFTSGMKSLFNGTFNEAIKIVFNILDINQLGHIEKEDAKFLLRLLSFESGDSKLVKPQVTDQIEHPMETTEAIESLVDMTFNDKETLSLAEFKVTVETRTADIFLKVLCFLYLKKPFNEDNIKPLRKLEKESKANAKPQTSGSPIEKIYYSRIIPITKASLKYFPMAELLNKLKFKTLAKKSEEDSLDLPKDENKDLNPSASAKDSKEAENKEKVDYEDYLYVLVESNKLRRYFISIIGKDIYYYKSSDKSTLLEMHNITGCFIREDIKYINNKKYYKLGIIFPKISEYEVYYFTESQLKFINFIEALKKTLKYKDLSDSYELYETIGSGSFASVNLGIDKRTNKKVALKKIIKEKHGKLNIKAIKSEVDILKICHHPNTLGLLDYFEDDEFGYIVTEYMNGNKLTDYMENNDLNISEKRASQIIYQIAQGILYLHSNGIVHRDLKPDNIMFTSSKNNEMIKIIDFGLSRILAKNETSEEICGSMIFAAPELLSGQPYGKGVDIWSLGVIIYYLLSGIYPFNNDEDDIEELKEMIKTEEVQFPEMNFYKRSSESIDLIKKCLTKDPAKRININEILEHKWFKKNLN